MRPPASVQRAHGSWSPAASRGGSRLPARSRSPACPGRIPRADSRLGQGAGADRQGDRNVAGSRHVTEDEWVKGGSEVGENGVRAAVPRERAAAPLLIVKVLFLLT